MPLTTWLWVLNDKGLLLVLTRWTLFARLRQIRCQIWREIGLALPWAFYLVPSEARDTKHFKQSQAFFVAAEKRR